MFTQILAAFFLLGLCIFFHELGHFLIGKWVGVQPRVFSIGYGRGIWFKKVGKTLYQVTGIPLGGFVQFYGDDITRENPRVRKGDFFSVGPWRRMALALGGPVFSILLGFLVIFFLVALGYQPSSNRIRLSESLQPTPAVLAGLQDNDRILSVNGQTTESFEKLNYYISLAASRDLKLQVERGGQELEVLVEARAMQAGAPQQIGIHPAGEPYLQVETDKVYKNGILRKGDKIMAVNRQRVENIAQLRQSLDAHEGVVTLEILRADGSIFQPGAQKKIGLEVPVQRADFVLLKNVRDVQTGKSIPDIEINSWQSKEFSRLFVGGQSHADWNAFSAAVKKLAGSQPARLGIGPVEVEAEISFGSRGMLGLSLSEGIMPEKAALPTDAWSVVSRSADQTVFTVQSTLLGLYRIIEGKLSFNESMAGPVKIVAFAAKSVSYGWEQYWFLLANITIILGIMNLLPIPVFDGGHVVFYLIEAVYKPLPARVIAASMRAGMIVLIGFGIYVIFLDVWDLFVKGLF